MKKILGSIVIAAMPLLFALGIFAPSVASASVGIHHGFENVKIAWHHFCHWHSGKGTLVVIKRTIGGDGSFQMSANNGGGSFAITSHHHFGAKTLKGLEPDVYTVTETVPAGWEQVSNTCTNVNVRSHRTAFCVIVNKKSTVDSDPTPSGQTGGLVITKTTTGGDGTFSFAGSAGNFSITTTGGTGSEEIYNLPADTYAITEDAAEGWHLTSSTCDSVVITAGATSTCAFTNEKVQATGGITVIKQANGGDGVFNFTGVQSFSITTEGGAGQMDIYDVPVGSFTLSETSQTGWTQDSLSCDNSQAVVANATTTCTVVNTKTAADAPQTQSAVNNGNGSNGGGNGPPSGGGGGGGGGGVWTFNFPQVLGASSTTLPELPAGCEALLTKYLRKGKVNDSNEVKKLQNFLNTELGLNMPVTGYFGSLTDKGVRMYQLKHKPQVLTPWSITDPTGYVYKTTQRWINLSACSSLIIPMPDLSS